MRLACERRCQSISCIVDESKLVPCNPDHGTKNYEREELIFYIS